MQKKKQNKQTNKKTYDTCEGTKKTLKYELYANQVMLLVIRLTMKKNCLVNLVSKPPTIFSFCFFIRHQLPKQST